MKTTSEIRQVFLDYFAGKDHRCVASSPLVPANDPTLLFTNAGMVQFKDVFLGAEKRDYSRAVTSQRCVRAGGKHNDLDEVGYTARHHTFFEMLGNFSFGDYFKEDAIRYSWELLTDIYGLSADRLWVTVYATDDEAYDIWRDQVGIPEERLIRIGDKPGGKPFESDNFWAMGDTGPCGPCTEIFYDHGEDVSGGPPGSADEDGDRYVEIWNLVFMQFDRDANGEMQPLPKPCVDTGMGLERITAVLQGVHNNYEIDLFQTLVKAAAQATGCSEKGDPSLNVIADHIRACSFLIVDGVLPSNEGRGYVLRRIIRRAVRHGYKLGQTGLFFHTLVEPLVAEMGGAYPELAKKSELVQQVLLKEEQRFAETLEQGMGLLDSVIADLPDNEIPGDAIFKLYDTYGFPVDLVADIARERDLTMDDAGFEQAMERQRERGRAAGKFQDDINLSSELIQKLPKTEFMGYEKNILEHSEIIGIINNSGDEKTELSDGESGVLILTATPFYAESGGQIGDTGKIETEDGIFEVQDTRKIAGKYFGHFGKVTSGGIKSGVTANARIDAHRRVAIVLHHSATHLMHAALKEVLGSHVDQKGSLVAEDRLRFDFSHMEPVTPEQLETIETIVNDQIRGNAQAKIDIMPYDKALETGAVALFGEKYGDVVRVMQFGDFSVELCGGTHVASLGDIGLFKITSEGGIAAGVRRIEAVAGPVAVQWMQEMAAREHRMAGLLRASPDTLEQSLQQLLEKNRKLEKENQRLQQELTSSSGKDLAAQAKDVNGILVLVADMDGADAKILRETVDDLKSRMKRAIIVLGAVGGGKVRLIAGVTGDITDQFSAGDVVNYVAGQVGGKGGGRKDLAQAGGTKPEALASALESVENWVRSENN